MTIDPSTPGQLPKEPFAGTGFWGNDGSPKFLAAMGTASLVFVLVILVAFADQWPRIAGVLIILPAAPWLYYVAYRRWSWAKQIETITGKNPLK